MLVKELMEKYPSGEVTDIVIHHTSRSVRRWELRADGYIDLFVDGSNRGSNVMVVGELYRIHN